MKVRVIKLERTEQAGYNLRVPKIYVGQTGTISKIHSELPAIRVELYNSEVEDYKLCWFHEDDLCPADLSVIKNIKKKVTFDPNDLVVGV